MTAVAFNTVSLGYAGRAVLTGITLAIPAGQFIGLAGPNGAGKTTLLRAIIGLARPQSGTIQVFGAPPRRGNPHIGYLPQSRPASLPPVRGLDLMATSLHGHRWGIGGTSRADHAALHWALDQVQARHLAHRPITALSGGERQRVLIAQALLGRPRLLLLDEPLAGLDPNHQQAVIRLIRDVQQRLSLTVICSAHDLNTMLPAVDQVLTVGQGRAALGAPGQMATPEILSQLYGMKMQVLRQNGRVVVLPEHGAW
jgi:zinc/manganese transport system ATP-binding protein